MRKNPEGTLFGKDGVLQKGRRKRRGNENARSKKIRGLGVEERGGPRVEIGMQKRERRVERGRRLAEHVLATERDPRRRRRPMPSPRLPPLSVSHTSHRLTCFVHPRDSSAVFAETRHRLPSDRRPRRAAPHLALRFD